MVIIYNRTLDDLVIFFNGNHIKQNLLALIIMYMMCSGFILLVNFVIVLDGNHMKQNFLSHIIISV